MRPYEIEALRLFRIRPQSTVTSVTTVTRSREPYTEGLFSVTMGVTVHELPTKGPSQRNAIGMDSVTTVTLVAIDCKRSLKVMHSSLS